jgi:hypothetical protein
VVANPYQCHSILVAVGIALPVALAELDKWHFALTKYSRQCATAIGP